MDTLKVLCGAAVPALLLMISPGSLSGEPGQAAVQDVGKAEQAQPAAEQPKAPDEAKPVEQAQKVKKEELGFVEGNTKIEHAVQKLKDLGVKNVQVHQGTGDVGEIISADGQDYLLQFGIFGYQGDMDLTDHMAVSSKPRNFAVEVTKTGMIFVTAEDFHLSFPSGRAKPGVLMCHWVENALVSDMIDISAVVASLGGIVGPKFYQTIDGEIIILHARNSAGKDWPDAYQFDSRTGKSKGRIKWAEAQRFLNF
jgi:hypothetical protein